MNGANSAAETKINAWILDYAFHIVWKEFSSARTVDTNSNRELIQWVMEQPFETNTERDLKFSILLLLCRLADGKNFSTRYQDNSELTVLEDALQQYDTFHEQLIKDFVSDSKNLQAAMKSQAVLVCCRAGDFAAADEVFCRLFPGKAKKEDKEVRERLGNLIKSRNKSAKLVHKESYECFVENMLQFFEKVIKRFKPPYLTQLATSDKCIKLTPQKIPHLSFGTQTDNLSVSTPTKRQSDEMNEFVKPKHRKISNKQTESPSDSSSPRLSDRTRIHISSLEKYKRLKGINHLSSRDEENLIKKVTSSTKATNHNKNSRGTEQNGGSEDHSTETEDDVIDTDTEQDRYNVSLSRRLSKSRIMGEELPKLPVMKNKSELSPMKMKNPWGIKETEDLYQAIQKLGVGHWAQIKTHLHTFRTNVQIKDKWRTIIKTGDLKKLEKKFGCVKK